MPPSTDDLLMRLLAGVERELDLAVDLRHRLHAHPELAHAEELTAALPFSIFVNWPSSQVK